MRIAIQHCKSCGASTRYRIPDDGDTKERAICSACHLVHYENPLNVVGTIPVWGAQVLLCKRNIEPRKGKWTLPAGFMENNETTMDAASRETEEEAGARIQLHGLFSLLNVPHVHQVHLFYRATLLDLNYAAGIESLEVKLFTEADIPWDEIAFPTVTHTLRFLFADLALVKQGGSFGFHSHDILKPMRHAE